jgi:ribonuclease D
VTGQPDAGPPQPASSDSSPPARPSATAPENDAAAQDVPPADRTGQADPATASANGHRSGPAGHQASAEDAASQEPGSETDPSAEPDRPAPVPLLEPREGLPPLIVTAAELARQAQLLANGDGPVAVDAERASGFRYGHRAFLVQIRRHGAGTMLIDPVACPDLSGIDAALADTEAVLHAASQDLPCLAELGYRPRRLFDTELAGRLLGYPRVGLGTLVETVLGFSLEKSHSAADWSTRPLPEEWLRYAALDVEVLVELRDALARQLDEQGKAEWAQEEFAAVLSAGPPPPRIDPWRRTSGIHRVRTRRGLAVVRELWQERDSIARRRDQSPTRVLPDSAIVEAARSTPNGAPGLARIPGFHGRGSRRYTPEWLRAISRARSLTDQDLPDASAQPGDGPPPAHRWAERDPVAARRLAAARAVVAALADEHGLPAENLLPPDSVRRLSWQPPAELSAGTVTAELTGHGARAWQAQLTSGPIAEALLRAAARELAEEPEPESDSAGEGTQD